MYLANEGRKDYLDFVKNIPIQAFFFFLGALFFHGGVSGHATVSKNVAGVILCLMGAGAAIASTSLFVESLRKHLIAPDAENARKKYPEIDADFAERLQQFSRRWWVRKRALAEVFIVILVIDFAFSAAAISAVFSAFNALHINPS
ncbi:hypothetical protein SCB29_33845 [Paraburkholderia sp. SIMBA_055]